MIVGCGIAIIANETSHPIKYGLLSSLVIATSKEVYDSMHPTQHTADVNDALSTLIGTSVCMTWEW